MMSPRPLVVRSPDLAAIRFAGPDAATFLHNQVSTDVAGMAVGAAGWSSYNSPKGRMLASPLLWRRGEAEFIAYVPGDIAEPLRKRLGMFVLRAKVTVEAVASRTVEGIVGPGAEAALDAVFGRAPARGHGAVVEGADIVALPDGRYLVDGSPAVAIDGDEAAASHWAWLGVRAGVPQIVRATQDVFIPQAVNFDLVGGINFRKGCYPGQEIVARMQYLGRLKERMFAFRVDGDPPAPGARVVAGESAGTVVNASSAPDGGSELLAVVNLAAMPTSAPSLADGRAMTQIPLPYDIPAPSAPNRVKL
jgi:tRNA-modifying protein YgfZ